MVIRIAAKISTPGPLVASLRLDFCIAAKWSALCGGNHKKRPCVSARHIFMITTRRVALTCSHVATKIRIPVPLARDSMLIFV